MDLAIRVHHHLAYPTEKCSRIALRTGRIADWLRSGVGLSANDGCHLMPAKHAADVGLTATRVVVCAARCVVRMAQTLVTTYVEES
jgi:hypothetical protein